MAVSRNTEMCLFTTRFLDDEAEAREIEVSYAFDHVFDRPNEKVRAVTLRVPLNPDTTALDQVKVMMHNSPVAGFDMGSKYNTWFSERFGFEVKLLWVGTNRRKVLGNMPPNIAGLQRERGTRGEGLENKADDEDAVPQKGWLDWGRSKVSGLLGANKENEYEGVDDGIGFADVAPYLVVNKKSWEDASRRLPEGEEMDITKFRPNIIVEGALDEYEEDFWGELEIGNWEEGRVAKIVLTNNCGRCNSLNVDYTTGKVGAGESGKILKKLNSNRRVDPGSKWNPVFGRYGFLGKVGGGDGIDIKVGDEVRLVRKNESRTRFGELLVFLLNVPETD